MNKLFELKKMGFVISWKLIAIGVYGDGEIPSTLTHLDVVDYLDSLLTENDEQTDNIITLVLDKDNCSRFDNFLKKLANEDCANTAIQKRKWRAYLLKETIDNIGEDYFQGLMDLMAFWISMGIPDDCPQTFPIANDRKSIQEYFTQASFELTLNENRMWLSKEIHNIIEFEN